MATKLTVNRGAGLERSAILAHVRRVRKLLYIRNASESVLDRWDELIAWIGKRHVRYAKRPGTLKGRR
jgi:hypothetical protein